MALYRRVLGTGGEASSEYRAASGSLWCRETIRVTGDTVTGVITNITVASNWNGNCSRRDASRRCMGSPGGWRTT